MSTCNIAIELERARIPFHVSNIKITVDRKEMQAKQEGWSSYAEKRRVTQKQIRGRPPF